MGEQSSIDLHTLARPEPVASYTNDSAMDVACALFLEANATREKRVIAEFLAQRIPPNAHIADFGGGSAVVLANILRLLPEDQQPRMVTFLEPTDLLIEQARATLEAFPTPIAYIHDAFDPGIHHVADERIDVAYESNAIPNFGSDLRQVIRQIAAKIARGGTFYSILPSHTGNQYGDFNKEMFATIRRINGWSETTTNDYAALVATAANAFAKEPHQDDSWTCEEESLASEFFYPMHGDERETIGLLLIFMFDLPWKDPSNPPEAFEALLTQAQAYLREKGMIQEDGIHMGLAFQITSLHRGKSSNSL